MLSRKRNVVALLIAVLLISACKRSVTDPLPVVILEDEPTSASETPVPTDTSAPTDEDIATETPTEQAAVTATATSIPPTPTSQPSTPTNTPTEEPVDPTTVPTIESGTLGEVWNLADIRYGIHDEWLRVVVEMVEDRDTLPYYEIKEVENATVPFPTGPDESWGEARIDLVISDLYAYDSPIIVQLPLIPPENPAVIKIGQYPTFDDALLGFSIGLIEPTRFTVFELIDPVRIVIDIEF